MQSSSGAEGNDRAGSLQEETEEMREAFALHAQAFTEHFGPGPDVRLFFAPGRVNLMGAHLDYNGGPVMPTAIDRGTFLALRLRSDSRVRLASVHETSGGTQPVPTHEFDIDDLPRGASDRWTDYVLGVILELASLANERGAERAMSGFDLLYGGSLEIGAGLSSSASICVGTAFSLDAAWELECPISDLVHAALQAERGFVGVQCGIMDPYAVGLSRPDTILWLDCKDAQWQHIPLTGDLVIAVADTGVRRKLAQGEFNKRVAECSEAFGVLHRAMPRATCLRDIPLELFEEHQSELSEAARKRARHVIEEVQRTFMAREALEGGRPEVFGAQMTLAHQSLRENFEVSCPELDRLVADATQVEGVLGSRLTGAGFGGCTVIFARAGCEAALEARLVEGFEAEFGTKPTVRIFGTDRGPREM